LHEEAARVGDERQDNEDRVDGQAPSNEGRPGCKTVAAEETPSKSMEQGGQETMPEKHHKYLFFSFFFSHNSRTRKAALTKLSER
jgi:hypothetical protein